MPVECTCPMDWLEQPGLEGEHHPQCAKRLQERYADKGKPEGHFYSKGTWHPLTKEDIQSRLDSADRALALAGLPPEEETD